VIVSVAFIQASLVIASPSGPTPATGASTAAIARIVTYLEILDAERQLFTAELGLAQAQRDELLAVVQLYKALGGGWQP